MNKKNLVSNHTLLKNWFCLIFYYMDCYNWGMAGIFFLDKKAAFLDKVCIIGTVYKFQTFIQSE